VRVLFLTHRLPYAPNRGDRVRAYHILKHMAGYAQVDVVSLVHDEEEASHAGDLAAFTSSVTVVQVPRLRNLVLSGLRLPTNRATTHSMLDAAGLLPAISRVVQRSRPDLVFAFCSGVAHVVFEEPLRGLPLVVDMVDVDSEKWADFAADARFPKSWIYAREADRLSRFEAALTRKARVTLVTTERERQSLLKLAPEARVEVVQNGVDVESLRPPGPPAQTANVVFCGVMNYRPNEEGAIWLAREVWPLVRAVRPDARLQIVGAFPTAAVRALAGPDIEVTGSVPDVRPYLWNAAVGVAPLLRARGVQNKVLEAVAAGLPVVVTRAVVAGLPPKLMSCVRVGDTPGAIAAEIEKLLGQPPVPNSAVQHLRWTAQLTKIPGLLRGSLPASA
jgi:sugar transferase (PEP-CTERM/EpsH1 system associated)